MKAGFLAETSVGVRLSDNLLNHAQIIYGIGAEVAHAERHRARFAVEPAPELAKEIARADLHRAGAAAMLVPRLLALESDDPRPEGLRRVLTQPRLAYVNGIVIVHAGRQTLQLEFGHLELVWRACEQLYEAHYRDYWRTREPTLDSLAQDLDDQVRAADVLHKLADLTGREPPHAEVDVYLLDSEALLCYSGNGDRVCVTTAVLSRYERFIYLLAHECAQLYLANPPWWEVEPCASASGGLPPEVVDAVETCAVQYLAATIALLYGSDPGFWMVHPGVEEALARRWPAFVANPEKGIDLLLEQVLQELRAADPRAAAVRPRRLSVTYDEGGRPVRCSVAAQRF